MEDHKTETAAFYLSCLGNLIYGFKFREPEIFSRLTKNGNYVIYTFAKSRIKEVELKIPNAIDFVNKKYRLPSKKELEYMLDKEDKEDIRL